MGKSVSATDMLKLGRSKSAGPPPRSNTPNSSDTATTPLVDQSSDQPVTTEAVERVTYMKSTVSLTPDQRRWLKSTVPALGIEGLSSSDLARLALARLQAEVENGLPLADLLVDQAHAEAKLMAGRRNRGLPRAAD